MIEGKTLLINAINKKYDELNNIDHSKLLINEIDVVKVYHSLVNDIDNLSQLKDDIIDYFTNEKKALNEDIKSSRDLLIGKTKYNLVVNLPAKSKKNIDKFINIIKRYIIDASPLAIEEENIKNILDKINYSLNNNELISDFNIIESIVKDYNEIDFEYNMVQIMRFINEHNLNIIETNSTSETLIDESKIVTTEFSEEFKEILDKYKLKVKDIPQYIIKDIIDYGEEKIIENYKLISNKKAEDYGISHLLKREDKLARLSILIYGSTNSIKETVDSLKNNNKLDVNALKILLNSGVNLFQDNEKHDNYIKIINYLKSLNINYLLLIKRCPMFMQVDYDKLLYTLDYLEKYGANRTKIINKCYKTISINMNLLIDNVEILVEHGFNMQQFFNQSNYNLLKAYKLDEKLIELKNQNSNLEVNNIDEINKLLIKNIYEKAKKEVD